MLVERTLLDANVKNLAEEYSNRSAGQLTVATTHTQARYALPRVVQAFKLEFAKVHLRLHQGSPEEIADMLLKGAADIAVATEALGEVAEFASFPLYSWHHAVIVPAGHALEQCQPLTLEAIAEHPIITYQEGFTGRTRRIDAAFARAGLTPDVVLSALDSDVIEGALWNSAWASAFWLRWLSAPTATGNCACSTPAISSKRTSRASRCCAATTCAALPIASWNCVHPT